MIIYLFDGKATYDEIDELRDELEYQMDDTSIYDDILDELGEVEIGGYSYPHSLALKRVDPKAYMVGMNDYYDSVISDIMYELEMADDGEIVYTPVGDIEVFEVEDGGLC